jgi:predicted deacylase
MIYSPHSSDICSSVNKGTRVFKKIKVREGSGRIPFYLPVHILRGLEPGPTLLLNAAIHGDEHGGSDVVRNVIQKVNLQNLRGTLIAVPVINITAYEARLRCDPVDQKDMNRIFPGNSNGTFSEQVAFSFFNRIARAADCIIDIHSAAFPEVFLAHARLRVNYHSEKVGELISAFGTELVWHYEGPEGTLQKCAMENGIPTITTELGKQVENDKTEIETGSEGVENVMKVLGMIDGTARIPEHHIVIKKQRISLKSQYEGAFQSDVKLGDIVDKGSILGKVTPLDGSDEIEIKSPINCIVAGSHNQSFVGAGMRLFFLLEYKKGSDGSGIDPSQVLKTPTLSNSEFRENMLLEKIKRV